MSFKEAQTHNLLGFNERTAPVGCSQTHVGGRSWKIKSALLTQSKVQGVGSEVKESEGVFSKLKAVVVTIIMH